MSIEVEQLAGSAQASVRRHSPRRRTVVGTGTLQIVAGGQTFDVEIGAESNTLAGIAAAINGSAAGEKVIATVVNGAGAARLTITARASGAANAMTITQSGGDGGLAGLVYPPSGTGLTQLQDALDAQVLIDGVLVTSSDEHGQRRHRRRRSHADDRQRSLATRRMSPSATTATAARKTIDDFVKSYNALVDAMKSADELQRRDAAGRPVYSATAVSATSSTNCAASSERTWPACPADLTLLASSASRRSSTASSASIRRTLDAAFTADFDAIGELFATDGSGVAVKLDALLEPYLDSKACSTAARRA